MVDGETDGDGIEANGEHSASVDPPIWAEVQFSSKTKHFEANVAFSEKNKLKRNTTADNAILHEPQEADDPGACPAGSEEEHRDAGEGIRRMPAAQGARESRNNHNKLCLFLTDN